MALSKKGSFLRGRRMRATLLDASGRPVYGDSSVVTTKGFVTVGYTTNTEDGEAINVTNAAGETCVAEPATPTFNGFSVEIEFCDVDFALFEMMTGQPVVLDENGKIIGITESTDVDLSSVNFALELWLGAQTSDRPSANAQGQWGYVLTPFLGGGVIGDISVENGAISFTLTGMNTKNGSGWGKGPYKVELVGGVPSPLRVGLKANDHRRIQYTEVAPPEVYPGATPLLDPTDADVTAITATATGLQVALAPTPAGTDPMWYDLGDGSWDYAETGSYTHTYDVPGEYTVIGYRGDSKATKTVTVASA
jgi:hypothetical protein